MINQYSWGLETPYLAHHGIKGQRWGVRRYQNKDGSYTQAGLARYKDASAAYSKAEAAYNSAKQSYKTAKQKGHGVETAKQNLRDAKINRKGAKAELNKVKKDLKYDAKADRGKELYGQGNTISSLKTNNFIRGIVSTVGETAIDAALISYDKRTGKDTSMIRKAISVGDIAISSADFVNTQMKISDMRAYYGHSGVSETRLKHSDIKKKTII